MRLPTKLFLLAITAVTIAVILALLAQPAQAWWMSAHEQSRVRQATDDARRAANSVYQIKQATKQPQATGSWPACSNGVRLVNSLGTVWSGYGGYGVAGNCPLSSRVVTKEDAGYWVGE